MNGISFLKQQGTLSRPLAGEDHISGFVFYPTALPPGFSASSRVHLVGSIEEAEALGVDAASATMDIKLMHYHIKEFFRISPGAALYVGCFNIDAGYAFDELETIQNYAEGKIRQVGVYTPETNLASAKVTALQAKALLLNTQYKPLSILYAANVSAAIMVALPDLRTLNAPNVSVVIGQDGEGLGASIYAGMGGGAKSITCLGAALGALSKAKVNENIGWVEKFPMAGGELDTAAFADGSLVKGYSQASIEAIHTKGYIFLVRQVGLSGSYFNDSATAVNATNDYAYIEAVRTIDKAIRGTRAYLLPLLNSPLTVDPSSGKIATDMVTHLEQIASKALEDMLRNTEVSGFSVTVDPNQNVLSTSKVNFVIKAVPVGVMRQLEVKIGYAVKLT